MPRHQLPAHTPITAAALAASAGTLVRPGSPVPVRRLGERLRRWLEPRDLLLCDSGTSALRMAIAGVLGRGGKAPVVLPAYSCYDVATAALGAGAAVCFYDLDPGTLAPDASSLQDAVGAGAAAVVIAHLYGIPVDVRAVRALVGPGTVIIEDAAQGFGGSLDGRPLGAQGSLAVLSFGRGKGVGGGGGGALLANDDAGAEMLRDLAVPRAGWGAGASAAVRLAAQWTLGRPQLYGLPAAIPWLRLGETVYRAPWTPTAITPAGAAAAVHSWEAAEREAGGRRARAERLLEALDASPHFRSVTPPTGSVPGYLRLPLVCVSRPACRSRASRLGIMPGYPRILPHLPAMAVAPGVPGVPGARQLAEFLITLPTHGHLTAHDLDAVLAWLLHERDGDD